MSVELNLVYVLIIIVFAKVFGELAARVGQPPVLGELLVGLMLGPSALGLVTETEVIHFLAEFGVILLLFEVGLESDVTQMFKLGVSSGLVAASGVIISFVLGYILSTILNLEVLVGIFLGAALAATSIGITARVLKDLGKLGTKEARIILGAAVFNDVTALVLLSIIVTIVSTGSINPIDVARVSAGALIFLVVTIVLGIRFFAPLCCGFAQQMRARGALIVFAVAFTLLLAIIAGQLGLATIVGAFASGLALAKAEQRIDIINEIRPVADVFIPVFFVLVGIQVSLGTLSDPNTLFFSLLLTVSAVLTGIISGHAATEKGVKRLAIGFGMVPRGEVGLIFAGFGLSTGLIDAGVYVAMILMVIVTSFVTPPALKMTLTERP